MEPGNHHRYMRECVELSERAIESGNPPFGSVLVHESKVILKAHNTTATDKNFARHAEFNILAEALERFGPHIFPKSTLYSTNEPCAMCAGAIYWSGIREVVYGLGNSVLLEIRGWGLDISGHEILSRGTDRVIVISGILEEKIREIHEMYWKT